MSIPWTAEEYSVLKELAADRRLSAAMIMRELNDKFGNKRTRNAIIGAAHRLHLDIGRVNKGIVYSAIVRLSKPRKPRAKPKPKIPKEESVALPPKEPIDFPIPLPKRGPPYSTEDLNHKICRWIDGDPRAERPFECTGEKLPGKPYCEDHQKRAFGPSYRGKISYAGQ